MKIFVSGGAGYIGSICVECMLDQGFEIVVFDNLSEGHRASIDPRATFIEGDLQVREDILPAIAETKPDAVMHFAAASLVGESMTNPSKYYRNNIGGGVNLLDAMVEAGVGKFVFSSTCATYGEPERVPMDERLAQKPISVYGHSKLMFEQILDWYSKIHGLINVKLRYFNAAGASEKFGEDHRIETHLIPNVLKVALGQRDKISIFGDKYDTPDGTCIRDYIHIKDLADAHIKALGAEKSNFYNLGSGEGYSVKQVIDVSRKVTGHAIPADVEEARPGDPPRLVASSRKIHNELGWKPQYDNLREIIESAWKWHSAHPEGYGD